MEFISFLLSGLLGFISPTGVVVDKVAENAIRSQFNDVEKLRVRVEHSPTHQLLQGNIKKIRIAGRGFKLKQYNFRIDALELETDDIAFSPNSIQKGKLKLQQPLQAGIRLIFTPADINKLLQSPDILALLPKLKLDSKDYINIDDDAVYKFANPQFNVLDNNKLFFQVELRSEEDKKPLLIKVEAGLKIKKGRQIQLIETVVTVNEEQVASQFVEGIVENLNQRLDLRNLEGDGLLIRILKFNIRPSELKIAAFVQIKPSSPFVENPLSPSALSTKPLTQVQVLSQPISEGVR
ncbi:Protein of unknown function (DUF2993) [Rivularia sp. PCC 7116]|uniref:LmeA family phospholipid-binding protein n=1 Tax=Rivularia sp. PCC 7116 TaxID=373994 RepID=UPI00029EED94|nr:DUF2993 domain-containing protein [Rivularia sp. PCC 7116]AFY58804.1 Protein of unknown function (DUF2993) [Rivularia sp. PCC 7116]